MKIILTGCPIIEDYIGKYFPQDIPVGKWGKYGCLSWSLAIPFSGIKKYENDFPIRNESTQEDYYIHCISDPFYTIHLFSQVDVKIMNIMIEVIKKTFNMDLNDAKLVDRWALLFLFWNKLIHSQNPDLVFKIEEPENFIEFMQDKVGIQTTISDKSTPSLGQVDISSIDPNILHGLDQFCVLYKYPLLSSRIISLYKKNENITNNPFNRMARMPPLMPATTPGMQSGPVKLWTGGKGSNASIRPGTGGVTINNRLVHNVYKVSGETGKKNSGFGISRKK